MPTTAPAKVVAASTALMVRRVNAPSQQRQIVMIAIRELFIVHLRAIPTWL
jgi:hypothetical protein